MLRRTTMLFILLAAVSCITNAQTTGTILGSVQDASGAVVVHAVVTVLNQGTALSRVASSNEAGDYAVVELPPGAYTVSAELTGFKKAVYSDLILQVQQKLRVDVKLELGRVTESVNVSGRGSVVETDSSSVGQIIDQVQATRLPLNGRNSVQLALLSPGTNAGPPGNRQAPNNIGNGSIATNGTRSYSNSFLIDGIDNNNGWNGYYAVTPSVDAIQEFKVQTSSYSAEFGRSAGAQVNLIWKTGSNAFHGVAFEYLRNDALDASEYFSHASGQPKPDFKRNQFGGVISGPIIKNKTFFVLSYEGYRIRQATPFIGTVPTLAMRAGDFSAIGPVYDPLNVVGGVRQEFPNDQIPADRISSASTFLQNLVPEPNLPGLANNFARNVSRQFNFNQYSIKIDQKVGANGQLWVRFLRQAVDVVYPSTFGTPALGNAGFSAGSSEINRPTNTALGYTHILSPNLTDDLRVGYNHVSWDYVQENQGKDYTAQAGIQGLSTDPEVVGFPQINTNGFTTWGDGSYLPQNLPEATLQISNTTTWVKGKHTLKAGLDFRITNRDLLIGANFRGSFAFSGIYTRQSSVDAGMPYADFLLGDATSATRTVGGSWIYTRQRLYHFFFQDDYKISRRLSLNLGLRYEYNPPIFEANNRFSNFDNGTLVFADTKYIVPGLSFPTGAAISRSTIRPDKRNFAPRFGFAYRLTDDNKTSLRGGYGLFYDLETGNPQANLGTNPPFSYDAALSGDPVTPDLPYQTAFATVPPFSGFPSISGYDQNFKNGYVQEWNLSLQREVLPDTLLDVAYVGSKGTKLINPDQVNQPMPGPGAIQPRRPYPLFAGATVYSGFGLSNYNSLQVKGERRFKDGLSFLSAYTFSRSIDTGSDVYSTSPNPYEYYKFNRGLSSADQTHRFTLAAIYELPVGRQRKYLNELNPLVNGIVGGWTASAIYTATTGFPFSVTIPVDQANTGTGGQRPNLIGNPHLSHPTINEWFNPAAFAMPDPYTYGNLGRNTLRGPGFSNLDFSLAKRFAIHEGHTIEFRAELFNIMNSVDFGLPAARINTPGVGTITSTTNPARQIQFALRYEF